MAAGLPPFARSAKTRSEPNAASRDHVRPPSVEPRRRVGEAGVPGTGESAALAATKTRSGSSSSTAIAWIVTLRPLPG